MDPFTLRIKFKLLIVDVISLLPPSDLITSHSLIQSPCSSYFGLCPSRLFCQPCSGLKLFALQSRVGFPRAPPHWLFVVICFLVQGFMSQEDLLRSEVVTLSFIPFYFLLRNDHNVNLFVLFGFFQTICLHLSASELNTSSIKGDPSPLDGAAQAIQSKKKKKE